MVEFFGLWLALDTTLGDSSRGLFVKVDEPPSEAENQKFASGDEFQSPYVADGHVMPGPSFSLSFPVPWAIPATSITCKLTIDWKVSDSPKPIDVDLIVDLGNTRTAVVALEHLSDLRDRELATYCHPIPILPPSEVFVGHGGFAPDKSRVITDSFLLLHQGLFAGAVPAVEHPRFETVEKKRFLGGPRNTRLLRSVTTRRPHQFCDFSPVWLGGPAFLNVLQNFEPGATEPGRMTLSSPKRYTWDTDTADVTKADQCWYMRLNKWNKPGRGNSAAKLAGEVLSLMPASGRDWPLDRPPNGPNIPPNERPESSPDSPGYPRSDALTWMALRILENSHLIINSADWRKGNREHTHRRLRRVVVTYPPGWSQDEYDAYKGKWQKAINIFSWTRFTNPQALVHDNGDAPRLDMAVDEAIASQLPIVLSEINRFGDRGQDWIETVGIGKSNAATVRIMSVDIGGGTTDVCIADYQDTQPGSSANLVCTVLFKDSSAVAGDELRKCIIERELLPLLAERGGIDREKFRSFFNDQASAQTQNF